MGSISRIAVTPWISSPSGPHHAQDRHQRSASSQPAVTHDLPGLRNRRDQLTANEQTKAPLPHEFWGKNCKLEQTFIERQERKQERSNLTAGLTKEKECRTPKINGHTGWAARRPRREQNHTVLLTTAFKSEDPVERPRLFMKSTHNQDLNENTFAARNTREGELRGQILLKLSLGGPIGAKRIYMTL